jgi:hypothetical protein
MALDGTCAGLKASIADWVDRNDAPFIAAVPDFIALFEATANTEAAFKSQFNRTSTNLTATANQNYVSTPSDFLTAESFMLTNNGQKTPLTNYGTATALYTALASATPGIPKGFIVLNGQLEMSPTPDSAYTMPLYYYQKIPALASNATNWLLTNYPQIYLFGSLVAAEAYLGSDPRLQVWGNFYDNAVQKLQGATDRNKYSGGALSVKVDAIV